MSGVLERLAREELGQRLVELGGPFGGEVVAGYFDVAPVQGVGERLSGLVVPVLRAGKGLAGRVRVLS